MADTSIPHSHNDSRPNAYRIADPAPYIVSFEYDECVLADEWGNRYYGETATQCIRQYHEGLRLASKTALSLGMTLSQFRQFEARERDWQDARLDGSLPQ